MRNTTDASSPVDPEWDWARMVLRPWVKGGHDRLYVRSPSGKDLGWLDRITGEVHAASPSLCPALERFLRYHVEAARTGVPIAAARPVSPAERRRKDRWLEEAARAARARSTLSEAALWIELERSSPFTWLREHVVGDYRLDFYSTFARLAVEVDGSSHRGREDRDAARDRALLLRGIQTLRLTAAEVERDTAAAVAKINRAASARTGCIERDPRISVPVRTSWWRRLLRLSRRDSNGPGPIIGSAMPYTGRRMGGPFACAGCRRTVPATQRSVTNVARCRSCADTPMGPAF